MDNLMCLLLFFSPSGFSCYGDESRGEVESQGKESVSASSISLSENNYTCSSSHLQVNTAMPVREWSAAHRFPFFITHLCCGAKKTSSGCETLHAVAFISYTSGKWPWVQPWRKTTKTPALSNECGAMRRGSVSPQPSRQRCSNSGSPLQVSWLAPPQLPLRSQSFLIHTIHTAATGSVCVCVCV